MPDDACIVCISIIVLFIVIINLEHLVNCVIIIIVTLLLWLLFWCVFGIQPFSMCNKLLLIFIYIWLACARARITKRSFAHMHACIELIPAEYQMRAKRSRCQPMCCILIVFFFWIFYSLSFWWNDNLQMDSVSSVFSINEYSDR